MILLILLIIWNIQNLKISFYSLVRWIENVFWETVLKLLKTNQIKDLGSKIFQKINLKLPWGQKRNYKRLKIAFFKSFNDVVETIFRKSNSKSSKI